MTKLMNEVQEACERTGIGRSKLYQLMTAGEIKSVKVGKRRLIPEEDLQGFVARLRAEQAS